MTRPLEGKLALVTGGSRGIGAAIAVALGAEGASVVLTHPGGVLEDEAASGVLAELERAGSPGRVIVADQADTGQIDALFEEIGALGRPLDILVNNAGISIGGRVDEPEADLAAFERQLAINVVGVAHCVRRAVPLMPDGGRIISIASNGAVRVPIPGLADYCASKAAVVGYTRGWARDLGPRAITVNALLPGPVETDMNPVGGPHWQLLTPHIALGRYGQPQEIAAVVVFLAGPSASFITGSSVVVDGGVSA